MAYYGAQKKYEMAIPIILVLLVAVVVAAKVGLFCPDVFVDLGLCGSKNAQILVISEDGQAEDIANWINNKLVRESSATFQTTTCDIEGGYLPSNHFKLVILAGDQTALPSHARDEITSYVENGGSLIILKGAGLRHYDSSCMQTSRLSFGWGIDDMSRIIQFKPNCPNIGECNQVSHVTINKDQMNDLHLITADWDHPIIVNSGLDVGPSTPFPVEEFPDFDGIIQVTDTNSHRIANWRWITPEGGTKIVPAVIAYEVGMAGTGGRVVYMAHNPFQFGIEQETLFRNTIEWCSKE
jgi:hypothetical protein